MEYMQEPDENNPKTNERNKFQPDKETTEYSKHFSGLELKQKKKTLKLFEAVFKKDYKENERKKLNERLKEI